MLIIVYNNYLEALINLDIFSTSIVRIKIYKHYHIKINLKQNVYIWSPVCVWIDNYEVTVCVYERERESVWVRVSERESNFLRMKTHVKN